MVTARVERRLAAILAADVAGYSRLMERDEAGTLARLRAHREQLVEPLVTEHHGRIVKLMGDGALCEFASVVDAVACAAAVQHGMAEREMGVPEDQRLRFRMGINLGDVIVEAGDIYGDGVNIAARLEQLADPGGIMISGTAFDQVEGKLDLAFEPLGEQRVKNIARPVRAYRIAPGAAVAAVDGGDRQRWIAPVAAVTVLAGLIAIGSAAYLGQFGRGEPANDAAEDRLTSAAGQGRAAVGRRSPVPQPGRR
jgi:class 3 adenylate cyclase